jgi:hypothetical protein
MVPPCSRASAQTGARPSRGGPIIMRVARKARTTGACIHLIDNRLRTTVPAGASVLELSIGNFSRFGENWDMATPGRSTKC